MPLIGWAAGRTVTNFISGFDHWVAFGLLLIVGFRMLWEAFHEKDERVEGTDISRGWLLFTLAFATSIDSLAVGLSFAFLDTNILQASLIIGAVAFLITNLAYYIGRRAGSLLGKRAKILGAVILIGIGIRIVIEHMLG
jgi:putative Mn2+ efflux pump MntP